MSVASALPLKNVAGYALERRLGRGAMGEVWLGRHVRTGRQAAVKLLPSRADLRGQALFEVERRAAARLDHPHILPIYEHGEDYLVAAYVRGMDLRQRLRAPMALPETLRIARALALALAHAHARGVIHRDVKPGNVLLDEQGHVYLADFGVAALIDDVTTLQNMSAGTRGYMAPEQSAGRAEKASDQYGLGRTLVAMLVGEPAADAGHALPSLAHLPVKLQALLARCLAERPADRYPTMDDLVEALDAATEEATPMRLLVERAPVLRSAAAFGWCRAAVEQIEHGRELSEARHSLSALVQSGWLPAEAAKALLDHTGATDLGFSVFGSHAQLGQLHDPDALGRVSEVVVLMHGLFCDRRFFGRLALELCRRHASRIVLAPDLHGQGASPYGFEGPALRQAAPRATVNLILDLLAQLGLTAMPTVLFAHSFSASGLLETRDDELPPDVQRVVLTPVFPHLMPSYRWSLRCTRVFAYLSAVSPHLKLSVSRSAVRRGSHAAGGQLSDEIVEMIARAIAATPARTISRHIDGLCASRPAEGALGRCVVVCVPDDPSLPESLAHEAIGHMNIPEDRLFMLASGGHFPFGDQADHPEWTARNVHDLCAIIDEAFDLPAVAPSDPTLPQTDVLGSPRYSSGPRISPAAGPRPYAQDIARDDEG